MPEETSGWYTRVRGRTLGPFTLPQLSSLRDRGQLSQFHEVSQDRRSWISAAEVPGLFSKTASRTGALSSSASADQGVYAVAEGPGASSSAFATEAMPLWFYAREGSHQGPVHLADLQRMAVAGEIQQNTLVWKSGLVDWIPAHQAPGLRFPVSTTTPAGLIPHQVQGTLSQTDIHNSPRTSGLAISSLVLGILWPWLCITGSILATIFGTVTLSLIFWSYVIGSVLATIFGAVALSQISRSKGMITGKGLAIAGLILGILGLSILVLTFAMGFQAAFVEQAQRRRLG
jgi:hypothetical protein